MYGPYSTCKAARAFISTSVFSFKLLHNGWCHTVSDVIQYQKCSKTSLKNNPARATVVMYP